MGLTVRRTRIARHAVGGRRHGLICSLMTGMTRRHATTPALSATCGTLILLGMGLTGCAGDIHSNPKDAFGRTYYIDGAGNWGFGVRSVRRGLERAGYRGNVVNHRWSLTLNPALDHTLGRPAARLSGASLGREITHYLERHPDAEVNIIALSAGTGVAVWACEHVEPPAKVNNLVLLGSSLASDYDVSAALANISGRIFVYHSRNDLILRGPVRTLGTIDGRLGVQPVGLVGLRAPGQTGDRVKNTAWSPHYQRWGWSGTHTDATTEPFVRHVLATHIVPADTTPGRSSSAHHMLRSREPASRLTLTDTAN